MPTLGAAPERGKLSAAKPGCRARFLFGYFLFCASKEKVTRRKGEIDSEYDKRAAVNRGLSNVVNVDFYVGVIDFC